MANRKPSSTTPLGWKLTTTNGTRRAINPQGHNVSYAQYLNAQARMSGFKSHSDYRKFAKKQKATLAYFRKGQGGAPKAKIALGSDNLKLFKEGLFGPHRRSIAPGSPLATFLEAIGWRPKGATYDVGETP